MCVGECCGIVERRARWSRSGAVLRMGGDDRDGDISDDGAQATLRGGRMVAEVSDDHLRGLRTPVGEGADESTVRSSRGGSVETVSELTRAMIVKACREKRFRPRAGGRLTVVDADVKYPTTPGWRPAGSRFWPGQDAAREADRGEEGAGPGSPRSKGRSPCDHADGPSSGEAKQEVLSRRADGELLERR